MSWKKSWFSPWPSCLSGLISTFCIADRIYLFGGFLSGITVWKADPRTGGRTPDRRQPTGAMQAWIGDGQHEQRQVLGGLLLGAGLCAARGRTLWCLSSPYKRGSGLRTLSQCWNRDRPDLRCSKGVWGDLCLNLFSQNEHLLWMQIVCRFTEKGRFAFSEFAGNEEMLSVWFFFF